MNWINIVVDFLYRFQTSVQSFFSLLLWPVQYFREWFAVKLPTWAKILLEVLFVLLIVGGLYYLQYRFGWDRWLVTSNPQLRKLKPIWLSFLGFLVWAAIRLFIYIIYQLPGPTQSFPDIDAAISAGLRAIDDERLDIRDLPLFLVVGLPRELEEEFAKSSFVRGPIAVTDRDLACHWYGSQRGVWICMSNLSAIGRQAELASRTSGSDAYSESGGGGGGGGSGGGAFATMGGGDGGAGDAEANPYSSQGDVNPLATLGGGGGRFATLSADSPGPSRQPSGGASPARQAGRSGSVQRLDADQLALTQERIRYFVKKLKEVRRPVCTVNGVLINFPFEWISKSAFINLASTAKVDMAPLQENLGVRCTSLVVFTEIEENPEFAAYVSRLEREKAQRRCGCGFPNLTTLDNNDFEKSAGWIVSYFERQVFELFQAKLGHADNGKLFRLLDIFRTSKARYQGLMTNTYPDDVEEPFYCGGVYFASLREAGQHKRAFFDGVLDKLMRDHDDAIGWNSRSIREDKLYRQWAGILNVAVVILALVDVSLIVLFFLKK